MGTIFVDNIKDNVGGKEVNIGDGSLNVDSTGKVTVGTSIDMNGTELILDADADTSITVDTDDNIDFKVGGADHMKFTGSELRLGDSSGEDFIVRLGSTGTNADTHAVLAYDKSSNYLSMLVSGESHGAGGLLVENGGNVGINTGTDPVAQLDVDGGVIVTNAELTTSSTAFHFSNVTNNGKYRVRFDSDSTVVGSIGVGTSSTAFNTSSDYRLKENVTYTFDGTNKIKQLKPARFSWIRDGKSEPTQEGFLAHEVSSIVPNAITGTKDGTRTISGAVITSDGKIFKENVKQENWILGKTERKSSDGNIIPAKYPSDSTWESSKEVPEYQVIDESKLVPLLVKAVQELEARITALESS